MMKEEDRIIYWMGQRDMIANIFMWLREDNIDNIDERKVLIGLANLYNSQFDGKNAPNPHVNHYLATVEPETI